MNYVPPHDDETEKALLSSLFVDPEQYHNIAGIVTAESFYTIKHQQIFQAIAALVAEGKPVDVITVSDEMSKQGFSPVYSDLLQIAMIEPTGQRAEYYAGIVREKQSRRMAIESLYRAMEGARNDARDIQDVIATVQKELDRVLPVDDRKKTASIYPDVKNIWDRILQIPKGGETNYIPTGFHDLDREVNLTKGTLTIIGASPRVGKTSLILCIIRHMARIGKRPLLFTLEMTRERIIENIIAQEAGICHRDMITGRLSNADIEKACSLIADWPNLNIGVLDGRWSVGQIRHRVIQEQRRGGVDAVFVDVLGKLPPPEGMKSSTELHKIFNANCQALQDLAIELHIPVILTAHLNRDKARQDSEGRPNLFSLREAGEEFSDNVLLIHRPYLIKPTTENKHLAEIIIAKNRDGDVGTVELGFDGPTKTFYNPAADYREEEQQEAWWRDK